MRFNHKILVRFFICFLIFFSSSISSLAYYNQKYEPLDGRVYHGMGQFMPYFYTDAENWSYVNNYQNILQKQPLIYSTYQTIIPESQDKNPNLYDIAKNHGYSYILLVGISYAHADGSIDVNAALNGDWDSAIVTLAQNIKALNSPVFVRPGFEFGAGSDGVHSGIGAADFITLWRRIYDIFSAQQVTNVAWVWNAVNPNQFDYLSYYPGDSYVDWWGINYFTTGQIANSSLFLTNAISHSKPVIVCESNPIENDGTNNSDNWSNWFVPYFNKINSDTNIKGFVYISNPWDKPGFFDWWPNSEISTNSYISQNYSTNISEAKFVHMNEYLVDPGVISPVVIPTPTPIPSVSPSPTLIPTPTPSVTPTPSPSVTPSPTSITNTYQISLSADDVNENSTSYSQTDTTIWLGNASSTSSSFTGLRFQNVNIPQNAVINNAYLSVYSVQSQWQLVNMNLFADASGNSVVFSSTNKPSQRTLTTNYVSHSSNVSWSANTWYALNQMPTVIQEVVNRSDWQSGNALSIILKGTGPSWARKFIRSYDGGVSTSPKIVITYTTDVTPTPSPTPVVTPTPIPSVSPSPTLVPTPLPTPTVTPTPTPTPSVSPTPSPSVSPTPTPIPSVSPSPTLIPTPSPSPTLIPTPTPSVTPTPSPSVTPSPTSITNTYQISLSADDVNENATSYSQTDTTIWLGNASSTSLSFTGLRFQNVNIPQNAVINNAYLSVYSVQSQWQLVNMNLFADASGNSVVFSSTNKPSQRTLTTNYVSHSSNVSWSANTWYALNQMPTVIQEVVNRSDWQSGNALSIILKGTGPSWARKFIRSYDGGVATSPRIIITYTVN